MILKHLQKTFQVCAGTDNSFKVLTCIFFVDPYNRYYCDCYSKSHGFRHRSEVIL